MTECAKVLKGDIVIPAGTVFCPVADQGRFYGAHCFEATIGLSDDTAGSVVYGIDPSDPSMADMFEDAAEAKTEAPRITPEHIESIILREEYTVLSGTSLTICGLTLENGFVVTGESACASPANFDAEKGRQIAREKAVDKVWLLEGYLLRQRLSEQAG